MKSPSIFLVLFFICFMVSIEYSDSQWGPDFRQTTNAGNSFLAANSAWCVATVGNTVHLAWASAGGYIQIYYRRSTDGGLNWEPEVVLTNNTWYSTAYPSIGANDSTVFVMYMYNHNASNELFFRRSTDAGVTWLPKQQYTSTVQMFQPSISFSGADINVAWNDGYGSSNHIYYRRSVDRGANWTSGVALTPDGFNFYNPSIAVNGNLINIVWYDNYGQVFYERSSDGGGTWGSRMVLPTVNNSSKASTAVSGSQVYAVWQDTRDGNAEIYFKRSTDSGISWGSDTRLTFSADSSYNPSIAVLGQNIHTVWQDHRDGNWEIYYKNSSNGGLNWGADTRLTNNDSISQNPSISVSGTAVHIIWSDTRDGNPEIYYKRNPTGNVLGIAPVSSEIPESFSLHQNYPNPFNPSTKIKFDIPVSDNSGDVKLRVFDALGREAAVLVNESMQPGTYEVVWNSADKPSGVYFYNLTAGSYKDTKRMVLLK